MNRRHFVTTTALASAPALIGAAPAKTQPPHIASNVYPWMTFYRRDERHWGQDLDADLAKVAQTGVHGFEPIGESPEQIQQLGTRLTKHGLEMRSLYVNSMLHDAAHAERSISQVLVIAEAAKAFGTRILVTNPSPIRWGGDEDKNDAQLMTQAKALDTLGGQLKQRGITLAYHNHDAELRQGAREFHHMLTATDPDHVKLCLDAHWVYRGCGNSQVALFDAVHHYRSRIVELHLRQSSGGVWNEVFAMEGDIDYHRLFAELEKDNLKPHLVLEQAVEDPSPRKLTAVQAHRRSLAHLIQALA